jgi:ESCRT-I complex subunit VPS28
VLKNKKTKQKTKQKKRLVRVGVPATVEHGGPSGSGGATPGIGGATSRGGSGAGSGSGSGSGTGARPPALLVMGATQAYITCMDALKLDMTAADQLFPLLEELLAALNGVAELGPAFEGKARAREWLERVNGMRAHEELAPNEARQLAFDLESTYNLFHKRLAES